MPIVPFRETTYNKARKTKTMPELWFFIGKGGVGKTTVSSAFAAYQARLHPREPLLLISTDPAHSLGDIFQLRFGDRPRRIPGSGELFGWQINAEKLFGDFLDRYREEILTLVEAGSVFSREEVEPLLDANLPGMAEMAALIAIRETLRSRRYRRLVIDTAPLGHTLRLFEMPEHFLRFLSFLEVAGSRDAVLAATFGGRARAQHAFLEEWQAIAKDVQGALQSEDRESRLVLVTTPEEFSLKESLRAAHSLAESGFKIAGLVLNRAINSPRGDSAGCRRCARQAAASRRARLFLRKQFQQVHIYVGEDRGAPILGTKELGDYGAHLFAGKKFALSARRPTEEKSAADVETRLRTTSWPVFDVPLTLTVGKGGVGKTTVSAALAIAARREQPQRSMNICSTDPAPSLDDVFRQAIGDRLVPVLGDSRLHAAEFDSVGEFRRWSERMKDRIATALGSTHSGIHVDLTFERQLLVALLDIVPPGVDEIFAVFRVLDLLEGGPAQSSSSRGKDRAAFTIIDMAPTGHALELLRMPDRMLLWSQLLLKALAKHRSLAWAQDAAVEIAAMAQRVRELALMFRDRRKALAVPVMLAEPLPDRETGRLLASLKELGAGTSPIFVNRILFERDVAQCQRCRRARDWQIATLRSVEEKLGPEQPILIIRDFGEEVAGRRKLDSFTRKLWQLQNPERPEETRTPKRVIRKQPQGRR